MSARLSIDTVKAEFDLWRGQKKSPQCRAPDHLRQKALALRGNECSTSAGISVYFERNTQLFGTQFIEPLKSWTKREERPASCLPSATLSRPEAGWRPLPRRRGSPAKASIVHCRPKTTLPYEP